MNERRQTRHCVLTNRARIRGEKGAVAVEFALILPILAMILLGTVTAGLAYTRGVGLSNAVREGSRFGATAVVPPATPSDWANDVISQVRTTQFDDSNSSTAICVRLWKGTAAGGAAVTGTSLCSQGNGSVTPALAVTDVAFPIVPSTVTSTQCVVQVLAARNYSISLGILPALNGTMRRGSVARYERTC